MLEICPHNDCTGCTACASICPHQAIRMEKDAWGFMRPNIDTTVCIDCGSCRKVCPALHKPERKNRLPEEQFYAAYHKDEDIRMKSSSGGAFSALASSVLSQGGYVCAASFDSAYRKVQHIIISNEKDLPALRASKYLQSDMGTCLPATRKLLQAGETVLFVGTPCQVAALHLFLRKEYEKLTTVDIICHGVPAPRIYEDYVNWLEANHQSTLSSYTFRDKRWSWYTFNMKAQFQNGSRYFGAYEEDPYFRGFLNDYFLRECCYTCQFSKHYRYADITISDFWGYSAKNGGFRNDDKGISMCMCNTAKGAALFAEAGKQLVHCPRPRAMSLANGGFSPRIQNLESRANFLAEYQKTGFQECINSYFTAQPLSLRQKLLYRFGRNNCLVEVYDKAKKLPGLLKSPKIFMRVLLKKTGL